MANLLKLSARLEDEQVRCIVETPRGSRAKLAYDPEAKLFTLSKPLVAGLTYPYDWGFVPSTRAPDGDPLDVMILHDAATFPGLMIACRIIGALECNNVEDGEKIPNPRVFVVPAGKGGHRERALGDVGDLGKELRRELVKFFEATDALEEKELEVIDWVGPKRAGEILDEAIARWKKQEK